MRRSPSAAYRSIGRPASKSRPTSWSAGCPAAGSAATPATSTTSTPTRRGLVGVCDIDGSPLVQRADDTAETIRARLALQLASLEDVVDHYASAGVLKTVDGVDSIGQVTEALVKAIGGRARDGQEVDLTW